MEKVINLLYDIEEKANKIIERASEEKTRLYEQLNKNLQKLDEEIKNDTNGKLKVLQDKMNQEVLLEKQALIDNSNKQLQDLEVHFTKDHDALVNKVFNHVIGV